MHVIVSEELQKPKQTGGSHSCDLVVGDNGAVVVDAFRLNQVFDHPKEGFKRLGPCINQTNSENIEAARHGNVAVRVRFRGTHVHEDELRIGETAFQFVHRPQQVGIRVVHHFFSSSSMSSEMTRTVYVGLHVSNWTSGGLQSCRAV